VKSILTDFRRSKTALSTILVTLDFRFSGTFTLENVKNGQNVRFKAANIGQIAVFDLFKSAKIDFT